MNYALGIILLAGHMTNFAMERVLSHQEEPVHHVEEFSEEVIEQGDPVITQIAAISDQFCDKQIAYHAALYELALKMREVVQFCYGSLVSLDPKYHPYIYQLAQNCLVDFPLQAPTQTVQTVEPRDIFQQEIQETVVEEDGQSTEEDEPDWKMTDPQLFFSNTISEEEYSCTHLQKLPRKRTKCYCSKEFGRTFTALWKHIDSHHRTESNTFRCGKPGCTGEFLQVMHVVHHWGKEGNNCHNELFICGCKRYFLGSRFDRHRQVCNAPEWKKRKSKATL